MENNDQLDTFDKVFKRIKQAETAIERLSRRVSSLEDDRNERGLSDEEIARRKVQLQDELLRQGRFNTADLSDDERAERGLPPIHHLDVPDMSSAERYAPGTRFDLPDGNYIVVGACNDGYVIYFMYHNPGDPGSSGQCSVIDFEHLLTRVQAVHHVNEAPSSELRNVTSYLRKIIDAGKALQATRDNDMLYEDAVLIELLTDAEEYLNHLGAK